jgi:hypothetical protein
VVPDTSVIALPLLPLLPLFPLLEGVLPLFFLSRLEPPGGSSRRTDEPTVWDHPTVTDEPIVQPSLWDPLTRERPDLTCVFSGTPDLRT